MDVLKFFQELATVYSRLLECLDAYARRLQDQFMADQLRYALARENSWAKADVPNLLQLGIDASHPGIERAKGRKGRGVVPKVIGFRANLDRQIAELALRADPRTPPHLRRQSFLKSRKAPELLEAAYRGETEILKRKNRYLRPAAQAEENVAKAAGLTTATVRRLCFHERALRGNSEPVPAISAAQLERFLNYGPA